MTLDATQLDTEYQESILVAILLCDWNVRGWTMLEALKGRNHMGVLCQNNQVVRFRDVFQHVCTHGRIDLVIFAFLLPHMLPGEYDGSSDSTGATDSVRLERVGVWLSHRPVSRKGDDMRIWSLCLNQHSKSVKNAADFWRQQSYVETGFLMSGSDRLSQPGLSWAPSTPFAAIRSPDKGDGIAMFHQPLLGSDSAIASIEVEGIWAKWRVCQLDFSLQSKIKNLPLHLIRTNREIRKIRRDLSIRNRHMALLQPASASSTAPQGAFDHADRTLSTPAEGILIAVCDSDHREEKERVVDGAESFKWIWRGVYTWPPGVALPEFIEQRAFWIA